ncbi:glycosyltransferase family 4 protein [Amedibacillus dolichus]|uniref:glycosyltransferase family 4 protein n=1 Tax=Amedibacillus dolichus TaxID=31971 RepID=UPI001EDC785C|nr:glycosyltransferase family 4 protein [Amedibacillus dolichus]MCG4879041.1 glycosyltransferase family 4 protein [Amedibacillus dolichus]
MKLEKNLDNQNKKMKVLMVGPARNVKGGMTTVVDNYFKFGLQTVVDLDYCESINDKTKIQKAFKEVRGWLQYISKINKYDIIHIHMASGRSTYRKIKYLVLAKKKKKKVIVHVHGGGFSDFYNSLTRDKKEKIRKGLSQADRLIVLSESWKVFFSDIISNNKINVLYNGVEIPNKFNKKLDNDNIIFLGRLCEDKGIYELLSALQCLKNEYPNILLNICGSGENEKVLNFIKKRDLSDNVKLIGWVSDLDKATQLKENSIFVLPSKFEAMPVSLLEAMAYENVPICTNVGGVSQIIEDGINGILIKDNCKETICFALRNILCNAKKKKEMAKAARVTVKNKFDIANNIKLLYRIYLEVMEENGV